MSAPPPAAVRWLERRLHPDERQELLGDLAEQYQQRVARDGVRRARVWFWREAIVLGWGFAVHRRDVVSAAHERTRGRWLLGNAASDWRYAWRSLWAARGTTTVALLTLTLSLGLSTAVFSLVNSLLLRPLPYPSADRIVRLAEARAERGPQATASAPVLPESGGAVSDVALGQFIANTSTLELVTPYSVRERTVSAPRSIEQRQTAEVGAAFLELVGATPVRGRLFVQDDAPAVVIVSESFWRDVLGADEAAVGQSMLIDGDTHVIAGIAAGGITFPEPGIDVWTVGRWRYPTPGPKRMMQMWSETIARLSPGSTVADASTEARQLGAQLAAADPAFLDGADVAVPQFRIRRLQDDLVQPLRPALLVLAVGMALVLVAACANLMNLLLARSTARHREMAVRLTLGAGRWRVVRPLLFEQILLSSGGAVAGGLLGWWLLRALPAIAPATLARLVDVQFDIASLLFVAVTALAIGLVVGLLPAWQLPSANLRQLSAGGRIGKHAVSAEAFRRGLVVFQVSLAVVLLVGAALLGRTMMALTSVHPGFVGAHALTFQVGLPDDIFSQPERQTAYFDQLMTRVRQHPSVVAAGVSSTLPLNQVGFSGSFGIEGRPKPLPPEPWPSAHKIAITTGYLEAIGTRVVRGRGMTAADSAESEPVALIDEALARTYFPGEDPIGRRLDYFRKMWRIVGVVEEIKQRSVRVEAYPAMYMPAPQLPAVAAFNRLTGGVAVRATGEAMDLVPFIRTAMTEVDTTVPMYAVSGLDTRLSETFAEPRFFALALGLFATLAVTVSVLGVFGVLSYAVERRQIEFGVRRALGGDTSHIMALVVRQAALIVAVGLAVGLGVAVVGTGLLRTLLFGVEQLDAATFAGAACVIGLVGLAAAALPAWRAMQVDPARALRAD